MASMQEEHIPSEGNLKEDPIERPEGKTQVFLTMVGINVLLNYDTGVIPASLYHLEKGLSLSFQEQAAIGSLVYIGLCTSSLVVSIIFQHYSARKVLILNLVLNSLFCFLFSLCQSPFPMYLSRFGMGFTQAFCVIYAPVWTNEFAPSKRCTQWMGILQCAVPLGVVFGYSVASGLNMIDSAYMNWRLAIQLQAFLEFPFIVSLYLSDDNDIDVLDPDRLVASGETSPRGEEIRIDSISLTSLPGFCGQMKMLIQNLVFVFLTLALCCLFFVVSGIQYWVTLYMRHVLNAPRGTVIVGFVLISTTAPILGVLTGGYVSDYYGGYKGKNIQTAMKICLGFGIMACCTAIPSGYVTDILAEILLLWFLLFFGACVVPSATGIIVNTMPKEFQSSSSAVSQLVYNLAGFFLAPVLSALIMDRVEGKEKALTLGFRFCLSFSVLSVVFAVLTYVTILHREKGGNAGKDNSFDYVEYEADDVQAEIARRVKPLSIS